MADVENDLKKMGVRGWRRIDRDRGLDIYLEGGQEPYTQWREKERVIYIYIYIYIYIHPLNSSVSVVVGLEWYPCCRLQPATRISLQPNHTKLEHTSNQEQYDQCGNSTE